MGEAGRDIHGIKIFPDPEGMLNWLHSKDLKIALNLHPAEGIRAHEEVLSSRSRLYGRE